MPFNSITPDGVTYGSSALGGSAYTSQLNPDNSSQLISSSGSSQTGLARVIRAKDFGAKGDGTTDDTTALTNWINSINSVTNGAIGFLDWGNYLISSPLPNLTSPASTIYGAGWAQAANTAGSTITATGSFSGTMLVLAAEGSQLEKINFNGAGAASTILAITNQNCQLQFMSVRSVAANGVCIDDQTGGNGLWMHNCRINGINYPNTGIQINATDAIITGCKPVNNSNNIVLLGGASGAIITNNHMTPGAGGTNCIYINGNPSHVLINSNRFDNYQSAAIQITAPSSTPNDLTISNNDFHSTVQTDNTFPLIAIDTTNNSYRNLKIMNNTGYAGTLNRPAYGVAALTQTGSVPVNTTKWSTLGTVVSGNSWYVATSLFANGSPSVALNNFISTDGTTWSLATDIYTFPSSSGSTSDLMYKQAAPAITPNATSNTLGTSQTLLPDGAASGIYISQIQYVASGVATETVTVQITVTWSDTTTTVSSTNLTTNGTSTLSAINLISALSGGDGKKAASIGFACKSTINSSTASIVPTVLGLNQN